MANGLTQQMQAKLLDHALKGTAYSQPTSLYVALHSADPTETEAAAAEISGGSYARQGCTTQWAAATAADPSVKATNADLTWTNMPACTVHGVSIWDTSSAGTSANCLWYGTLSADKTVNAADTFKILSGNLSCTLT